MTHLTAPATLFNAVPSLQLCTPSQCLGSPSSQHCVVAGSKLGKDLKKRQRVCDRSVGGEGHKFAFLSQQCTASVDQQLPWNMNSFQLLLLCALLLAGGAAPEQSCIFTPKPDTIASSPWKLCAGPNITQQPGAEEARRLAVAYAPILHFAPAEEYLLTDPLSYWQAARGECQCPGQRSGFFTGQGHRS